MKKIGLFVLGIVVGILLAISLLALLGKSLQDSDPLSGLVLFESPGKCLTKEPIKVFQVLTQDSALATERSNREYDWYNGKVVLIINNKGETYYDDQVIKTKTCFRQVGIFKYQTNNENWKTVPVVEIE